MLPLEQRAVERTLAKDVRRQSLIDFELMASHLGQLFALDTGAVTLHTHPTSVWRSCDG